MLVLEKDGSKELLESQAGRTGETESAEFVTVKPNLSAVSNTLPKSNESNLIEAQLATNANVPDNESKESEISVTDYTFKKPLKLYNRESPHLAHVSSLRSEFLEKFQEGCVTEIKSNGAFVKTILAEFQKSEDTKENSDNEELQKPDTDVSRNKEDLEAFIEQNYMSMTLKRSLLDTSSILNSSLMGNADLDENPYVEMSQGASDTSLLSPNSPMSIEQQPYEMIYFSRSKMEPLYMELSQLEGNILEKTPDDGKSELNMPDILLLPGNKTKSVKSDSSDADDEASKNLDSLDTPSHPRFSLSDNFRPASYYLNASLVQEFQDSSDSELVSPPPIPKSPPPLDDLENIDFSFSEQDKRSKYANRNSDQYFNSNNKFLKGSKKHTPYSPSLKDNDASSLCSINTDSGNRSSRQSSELDFELRFSQSNDRIFKRRPFSEQLCSDLETIDIDRLDECLLRLEESNLDELITNSNYHDYENFFIISQTKAFENRAKTPSFSKTSTPINQLIEIDDGPRHVSTTFAEVESIHMDRRSQEASQLSHSAPYYYSDLSINVPSAHNSGLTLNNQRDATNNNKKDITHIVNPIRCNRNPQGSQSHVMDDTFKLAVEARSVSADFLNLTDKSGHIDKKNLYESDTLKRLKVMDSISSLQSNPETVNLYPSINEKLPSSSNNSEVRRAHSLEGLLESVLSETIDSPGTEVNLAAPENETITESRNSATLGTEGSYLWEEDSVWRERLRSASQRHTRSLDDLDCIEPKRPQKKQPRAITRDVTYVNDIIYNMPLQQQKELEKKVNNKSDARCKENSFILDREKLRQWDLMSSAPSDAQINPQNTTQVSASNNTVLSSGEGNSQHSETTDTQEPGINIFVYIRSNCTSNFFSFFNFQVFQSFLS